MTKTTKARSEKVRRLQYIQAQEVVIARDKKPLPAVDAKDCNLFVCV